MEFLLKVINRDWNAVPCIPDQKGFEPLAFLDLCNRIPYFFIKIRALRNKSGGEHQILCLFRYRWKDLLNVRETIRRLRKIRIYHRVQTDIIRSPTRAIFLKVRTTAYDPRVAWGILSGQDKGSR